MLDDQQSLQLRTFGYTTLPQLFSGPELERLRNEYEPELSRAYADQPFDGTQHYWTPMLGDQTPFFASLLEDERFCSAAEQLFGADVIGVGTDTNRYVGNTKWHPDHVADPARDCYGVKFAFYLDPVDAASGALRLVPGSHLQPFHHQIGVAMESLQLAIDQVPNHVCESQPGDVVAFDMRCWHGSWGGATGRRMCTCVYYNNPKGAVEETATRKRAANAREIAAKYGRPGDAHFPPSWLANTGGSPKRQRWLERMAELGYFELPAA